MILIQKKYKTIDILWISFKIEPFFVVLQILLAIVQAAIPTAVLALSTAFFIDTALDIFNGNVDASSIYLPIFLLILIISIKSIISSLPNTFSTKISLRLDQKLMPYILKIHASLKYEHIENKNTLELIERISKNLSSVFKEDLSVYITIIHNIAAIISILIVVGNYVWWSSILIILLGIPFVIISNKIGKKIYEAEVDTYDSIRRIEYYIDEILINRNATDERTLFGYTKNILDKYNYSFNEMSRKILKDYFKGDLFVRVFNIFIAIFAMIICTTMIYQLILGYISSGIFVGIVGAIFGLVGSFGSSMQGAIYTLSRCHGYMKDLTEFISLSQKDGAIDLPDAKPIEFKELEFVNVKFRYPSSDEYILNNISFKIESGKHYAFVGVNGAGKTTIIKLLTGLYDSYEGQILINGEELRTYNMSTIKSIFSLVQQDFARYEISIAENISIGNINMPYNEKEIYDVIAKVDLIDLVNNMEYKINTNIGKIYEQNKDLSTGEWQKIAIARSLISQAPIKILDEPTAALDPIAESKIYQEFEKLMSGTTIFISHRLGSTKLANEILVIENGMIREKGNHDQLMDIGGIYKQMFDLQRKWYE